MVSILSLEKFAESGGRQAPPGAGSYMSKILEMGRGTAPSLVELVWLAVLEEAGGKKAWNRRVGSRRE